MVKKQVAVVALDPRASRFYSDQVQDLFGSRIEVHSYSVRDGSVMKVQRADLYLLSTDAFESAEEIPLYIPIDGNTMEIQVTYRWDTIRRLQEIGPGTKAYYVNLTEKMAREATSTLNQLGVNHIEFELFYPGARLIPGIRFAITPDEERYVPEGMDTVLNIGHRSCTSAMMIEAALRLGMDDMLEEIHFKKYYEEVATNNYNFNQMFMRSLRLESQFDILMGILDQGIIGVNEKGEVFACNQKAKELTKVSTKLALGRRASEVFPYLPFYQCMQNKKSMDPKVIRLGTANINMSVTPVMRQGECIGAFASLQAFNDVESRQNELRAQLLHKGCQAKYTFDDVLGNSPAIQRTKAILKRMAATESPVLLIGETGTGKELFAHAVHLASQRVSGPFVAINCAAMPENLLESELFGYEEGAFTGARKGGRPGLFEFAHHGTLFLDEVEGMSPALQVKLLRVLQEGEVMRVGGNKIISIDVRIVAATNEYLEEKIADGSFRRDLYYRLNTLPALIPPLKERGHDIMLLVEYFKQHACGNFQLSGEVEQIFQHHMWPGNIRELRNVVEYFCYTGSDVITSEDLPPTFFYQATTAVHNLCRDRYQAPLDTGNKEWNDDFSQDQCFVLEQLYLAAEDNRSLGREQILAAAKEQRYPISQQEVRKALTSFHQQGLAKVSRGRGGSRITPTGCRVWEDKRKKL